MIFQLVMFSSQDAKKAETCAKQMSPNWLRCSMDIKQPAGHGDEALEATQLRGILQRNCF